MTQAAVAADLSQALDVKRSLTAQVTFHDVAVVDALTQLCFFLVGEVFNSGSLCFSPLVQRYSSVHHWKLLQ